jgi:16S rRNA C1402 (ribose-2'-O) methylase RsmI
LTASTPPSVFLFAGFLPVKDQTTTRRLGELEGNAGNADLLRVAASAGGSTAETM